ncbi:MAG TPA: ATP-binding protein [Egibacteraceae bacterium]|nr:ATP-binding protein [Egibacteraceae bacterium]
MSGVELHLPPHVQYVALARLVVTAAARQAGMSDERLEDLKIAVSEATANAIIAHASAESPEAVVLFFGATGDGMFEVTIRDAGPGFDPGPAEADMDREWASEGGLGVVLIRGLADDVQFVRGEGMKVHMRFGVGLNGTSH